MHLMSGLGQIFEEMFAYHRYRLQTGPEYDALLLGQHRAICEAIRRRDGRGAAEAAAEHLETVLSSYANDQDSGGGPAAVRAAAG
jgi:DNA-binding FadR family transcriptional regulator